MSTIKFNFFRFSWKFIFMGQFFILIFNFRIIFIVVYCVVFNNKTLRWMALRRSHFQCGKCEGRRSQSSVARTPSLALPPRWARKEFCVVVCATLLTFVCMLRYWMRNVVPRGLQWNCNEVLDVQCTSAGLFLLPSAIFRLSVELPVQKHTGTS